MKALLIIDMQIGSFSSKNPRFDANGVIQRIDTLANYFRSQGDRVIFIQHDGTKENFLIHGTSDWNIVPALSRRENDIYIEKTANDSFYRTDLESTLKSYNIRDLYITGCATDFCVNATIHSALVKDFNITVVRDCHTTADRPNFKAEKLIDFHNWLWANLTPTNGTIEIKKLKEIIS
jgi:nicotinamidase-related amidase